LMMTPADRGKDKSLDLTVKVVAQRKEIAESEHTAFWSLFDAMGGENSMGKFVAAKLAYFDAVHFNDDGGTWMADRLQHVLLDGFAAYMKAHPDAGCE
jgi:lysophospholipase L1-like esterase